MLSSTAQSTNIDALPTHLHDQIESYLDDLDDESDFEFNTIGAVLVTRLTNPLPLNQATAMDLEELFLLSDIQIDNFLQYRNQLGNLLDLHELQAIPSFDVQTIQRILPYITIRPPLLDVTKIGTMVRTGQNEIYLRWNRFVEEKKGFRSIDGLSPKYEGSPDQYYIRYRHKHENRLSYGFTLEKDAGETFFRGSNKQGFDFHSLHFYLKDPSPIVRDLALGDYAVSLGQGLIMHSGFGRGKSSLVTQIKKGGRTIRPYSSVNEAAFLRGGAVTLDLDPITIVAFGSRVLRDGNIKIDSFDRQDPSTEFSSLQLSGLHRTESESDDEKAIVHHTVGGKVGLHLGGFSASLNIVYNKFDHPFKRTPKLYNQFYFTGSSLMSTSVDYAYRFKNFHLFGETAYSNNGGMATINGVLMGLTPKIDLALLYRNLARNYQSIQANPFIESSQPNNERGFYIGSEIRFNHHFSLRIYGDVWHHPWLRFAIDAPSYGSEYFARFTYYQKRKIDVYIQFRSEQKDVNHRNLGDFNNRVTNQHRSNLRIHFSNKSLPNIELRNRIEYIWRSNNYEDSQGFMLYQDIIFRSINSPFSFTTRIAYFDTDDYSSRIYAYENDILYQFSIPAYYGQGIRYYFNARWRLQNLTLEARWEQSRYRNQDLISSGNEQIIGNTRSRIKLQVKYVF